MICFPEPYLHKMRIRIHAPSFTTEFWPHLLGTLPGYADI